LVRKRTWIMLEFMGFMIVSNYVLGAIAIVTG
jgi:hypothetical protein